MTPDAEQIFETSGLPWVTAQKTRPMRIKHLTAVCSDLAVQPHLLLRTLEGDQALRQESVFVCVGPQGEMWQQTVDRVFQKYTLAACSSDGWFTAQPKPDKTVEAYKVERPGTFHVRARWGTLGDDGTFFQSGREGDWIVRSPEDPGDVWIVRGTVFAATYEVRP